jgi:hypothetical protein
MHESVAPLDAPLGLLGKSLLLGVLAFAQGLGRTVPAIKPEDTITGPGDRHRPRDTRRALPRDARLNTARSKTRLPAAALTHRERPSATAITTPNHGKQAASASLGSRNGTTQHPADPRSHCCSLGEALLAGTAAGRPSSVADDGRMTPRRRQMSA